MNTFRLEIVVLDKAFYSGDVQELVVKTPEGEVGILKGHVPMAFTVSSGRLRIKKDEQWSCAFVSEGFMEVTGDKAVVLADSAEWPEEIDYDRAKAAEERARGALNGPTGAGNSGAREALQRALWRQRVKNAQRKEQ